MAGPEIEPWTPATLVRSSTTELCTVHIAPTTTHVCQKHVHSKALLKTFALKTIT